MTENIKNTPQSKLSRAEQAWAKKTSKHIGYSLFGDGSSYNRKEDTNLLYNYLCEILVSLKAINSEFDIDVLSMQEAAEKISDNENILNNKSELNQFIYDNYTSYTFMGLINGGIQIKTSAYNDGKLKKEFQKLMGNIYNKAINGIDPRKKANFSEEKYKRFGAIKKKSANNPFEYQKWEHGPRPEKDLELIFNNNKYLIPAYSVNEIDDSGHFYKVIYPMINATILELFAKDKEKENQNLHQWLTDYINSLKDQIIIADINADISNAYEIGSYLRGINLSGSIIRNLYIIDADCRDMNLQNCDILNMSLNKCLYGNLDLRGADTNRFTIDAANYEDSSMVGFSSDQYQEDSKLPIRLSITSTDKANAKGIITDSLYDALNKRALLFPFYVRGCEEEYLDNNQSFRINIEDLKAYIEEINQLDIVKSLQSKTITKIDWTQNSIPSLIDFIKAKPEYADKKGYIDISEQDLSSISLNYGNFRNVNFAGCQLKEAKHANFFGACLEGVEANNANFEHSIFIQANMQYISAESANFEQVNMNDANLECAELNGIKGQFQARRANMKFASLENAEINNSNLSLMRAEGITLANAHVNYCQIRGAKMVNAILKGAEFNGTDFTKAIVIKANAELAVFKHSTMAYINAQQANFKQATMEYIEAQGADFSDADMKQIQIQYSNFSSALLNNLNASNAKLFAVSLENAKAIGVDFENAVLQYIKGKDLNLAFAMLGEAKIKYSHLMNSYMCYIKANRASFESCYMKQVDMELADLMGAEITKTNLVGSSIQGANLTYANIDHSDLSEVEFDNTTSLVGIRNLNTARIDKSLEILSKKQHRDAFPIRSRIEEIKNWGKDKTECVFNILQDMWQIVKNGLFSGSIGSMLGLAIGIGIIALLVPTAGIALTMALCFGGALVGGGLSIYYNNDTTKLFTHINELLGLQLYTSDLNGDPECISEEKIEEVFQEKFNFKVEPAIDQISQNIANDLLKIKEDLDDINANYKFAKHTEESGREPSKSPSRAA